MYNLPFTIEQVVNLFPIKIKYISGTNIYAICPFCNKVSSLHIDTKRNIWNCAACGHGGGTLDFYTQMNNMGGPDANRDAYKDLCQILNVVNEREQKAYQEKKYPITQGKNLNIKNSKLAPVQISDHTYRTFLHMLTLNEPHKESLIHRGLDEQDIASGMFKSTPTLQVDKLIDGLLEFGCQLEGVPGFYYENRWKLNVSSKASGIFIPVTNREGYIVGMQIRMDHSRNSQKYIWLSSANKNLGCSSGSPLHFIGDPVSSDLILTEGPLKAIVARALSIKLGRPLTFVAIAGSGQIKAVKQLFQELHSLGYKRLYEALDMDKYENPNVLKNIKRIYSASIKYNLNLIPFNWNTIAVKKFDANGKMLFRPGDQYKIFNVQTREYMTYSLGTRLNTNPNQIKEYDTFYVDERGILVLPEPLINPKHPHENIACQLIDMQTGESVAFQMYVDKGAFEIKQGDICYQFINSKGIDDYYLNLYLKKI